MKFSEWDEFTHWGPSVKSMFLFDVLGYDSPISLNNPNYPPGLSVFSYIVVRIGQVWDESDVFWAYQLIFIAIVASALPHLNFKKMGIFILFPITLLLSSSYFYNVLQTIYADPVMSIIFGFSLLFATNIIETKNIWDLFRYLVTLSFLTLVKDFGIVLAFLSISIYFINLIARKVLFRVEYKRSSPIKLFLSVFILISGVLISRFLWATYVHSGNLASSSSSAIVNAPAIFSEVSSTEKLRLTTLIDNFYGKVFDASISLTSNFSLTTFNWIIIFSIFSVLLIVGQKSKLHKLEKLISTISIIMCGFIYLFLVLVAYITQFNGEYALSLPSFERYVSAYFSGVMFYFAAEFIKNFSETDITGPIDSNSLSKKRFGIAHPFSVPFLSFLLINSAAGSLINYYYFPDQNSTAVRSNFDNLVKKIQFAQFSTSDSVGIIAQHTVGFEYYVLQYEVMPASVSRTDYYMWSIGSPSGPGDVWTNSLITRSNWNEYLATIDYLVVNNVTQSFLDEFGTYFEDPDSLNEQGIYRVEMTDSGYKLIKFV